MPNQFFQTFFEHFKSAQQRTEIHINMILTNFNELLSDNTRKKDEFFSTNPPVRGEDFIFCVNSKKMQKRKKSVSSCSYASLNWKKCYQIGRRRSDRFRRA
jgi:hypothetical protein